MRRHAFQLWYNTPGDGGAGGGAPSPAPAPPAAAPPAAPPTAAAPPPAAGGTPPAPGATPPVKKYEYTEDRGNWVPRDQFDGLTQRERQAVAESKRFRAMLEADTGVSIGGRAEPESPEILEARAFFLDKILTPEMRAAIEFVQKNQDPLSKLAGRHSDLMSTTDAIWEERGAKAISTVHEAVAKDLGVATLTPFQQKMLGNSFIEWIKSDGQLLGRYSRGDMKVVEEFLTEYRSGFVEPARRASAAPALEGVRRAAGLPRSPVPGAVIPPGTAPKPKKTEDEVHDSAFAQFAAGTGR